MIITNTGWKRACREFFLCACSVFLLGGYSVYGAFAYPIRQVTNPACKIDTNVSWDNVDQSCKIDLPIIENGSYTSYANNPLYRGVYSVLRGATYRGGRDSGAGSHAGVDIVSARGTPVYAITTGRILTQGYSSARGSYITIAHAVNGVDFFVSYAHLDVIYTQIGQDVSSDTIVGTVGDSGNATAPHLHRQIERGDAPTHPYRYGGCARGIQSTVFAIVNNGLCRVEVLRYTIDPIRFVALQDISLLGYTIDGVVVYDPIEASKRIEKIDIHTPIVTDNTAVMQTIIPQYLGQSQIARGKIQFDGSLATGSSLTFKIQGVDLTIFPETLTVIDGTREILLWGDDVGTGTLLIYIGDRVIARHGFVVTKTVDTSKARVTCIQKKIQQSADGYCLISIPKNATIPRGATLSFDTVPGLSRYLPRSKNDFVRFWTGRVPSAAMVSGIYVQAKDFIFGNTMIVFYKGQKSRIVPQYR